MNVSYQLTKWGSDTGIYILTNLGVANTFYKYHKRFQQKNKTVTCLVSTTQVIHYEWGYDPMNSRTFADFLRIALIGYTGYYIILDNVSFHKSRCVNSVLQELGVTPIFIDPYCPEQNPIEEVFSCIKQYVRKVSPADEDKFDRCLRTAMRRQKQSVLTKYFARSVHVSSRSNRGYIKTK